MSAELTNKENFDCPHCGQDLRLPVSAYDDFKELEKELEDTTEHLKLMTRDFKKAKRNLEAEQLMRKTPLYGELEAKMLRGQLADERALADRLAEALKKISEHEQYSCDCVGGECSCDFRFMQFTAEEALAAHASQRKERSDDHEKRRKENK